MSRVRKGKGDSRRAPTMIWRPQRCGKNRYPSKAKAREERRLAERHGAELHIYECAECQGWHLSSMPIEFVRRGDAG